MILGCCKVLFLVTKVILASSKYQQQILFYLTFFKPEDFQNIFMHNKNTLHFKGSFQKITKIQIILFFKFQPRVKKLNFCDLLKASPIK